MNESGGMKSPVAQAIDIAINLGVVILFVAMCLRVLSPFLGMILWGGIIAIAIHPLFLKLQAMLGGRRKVALTLIVFVGLGVIIVPLWSFTQSLVDAGLDLGNRLEAGTLEIRPPNDSVRDWPVIGERVFAAWSDASSNLSVFVQEHNEQIKNMARTALSRIARAGPGVLEFLASILIAAAFLAYADGATSAMRRLIGRFAGQNGEALRQLAVATTRSITVGVLGIAAIQAVAAGLGIAVVGLPAAGLWALIVLILAIVQLPPWLIMLPLAVYVFSIESTTVAVLFLLWAIVVSFSDLFLKPMLLGRGVDAPMIVILLGAIGGLITLGIVGLFVGSVVLGLGYKLFQMWLAENAEETPDASGPAGSVD